MAMFAMIMKAPHLTHRGSMTESKVVERGLCVSNVTSLDLT